jgi:hypothetical protein
MTDSHVNMMSFSKTVEQKGGGCHDLSTRQYRVK